MDCVECIKAGLCGRDYVSVTTTNHKPHYPVIDCQRAEALWFKIKKLKILKA